MPIVSFKCPNCTAPLGFDPESGEYACEYCGSVFTQQQLDDWEQEQLKKTAETATDAEGAVFYVCPSCGAQIVTDDTTAATFCYYCHNPVIVAERLSESRKPDLVLPFRLDRDAAVQKFLSWVKTKKFVPRDFFSEDQIEKITGVYYPYWVGEYDVEASYLGSGTRSSTMTTATHRIITTKYYTVRREGKLHFKNLIFPALSKTERTLDAGIHPFYLEEAKPFAMGYLSGFQAEKWDVENTAAMQEFDLKVHVHSDILMKNHPKGYETLRGSTTEQVKERKLRYALLPSWILTYRGKDQKMYYYALNGQTGAICGDLPVDKKKLSLFCLWIALAALVLLLLGGYFVW